MFPFAPPPLYTPLVLSSTLAYIDNPLPGLVGFHCTAERDTAMHISWICACGLITIFRQTFS